MSRHHSGRSKSLPLTLSVRAYKCAPHPCVREVKGTDYVEATVFDSPIWIQVTIEDMNTQEEFRDREYLNPEIKEMLFALNLIQSYGSGIRRAKRAMEENGNPPMLFNPLNDTDDYTMVICPISEEFAYIRDHEDVATRKPSEKTVTNTQETTPEHAGTTPIGNTSSEKTSEKIKNYLRSKRLRRKGS